MQALLLILWRTVLCVKASGRQSSLPLIGQLSRGILGLEKDQEVFLCLALGYPAHKSTVVPVPESGTLDYYVDEKGIILFPKRTCPMS